MAQWKSKGPENHYLLIPILKKKKCDSITLDKRFKLALKS